jgi:hypothetical protein
MITNCCCITGDGQQHFFDQIHSRVFAQCWSLSAESDALWRIYSTVVKDASGKNKFANSEGVKVRTTSRKLLAALEDATDARGVNAK